MTDAKQPDPYSRPVNAKARKANRAPEHLMPSHTTAYDSAQKEGYDTAINAPETGRAVNEIHANSREMDREREEDETLAQKE